MRFIKSNHNLNKINDTVFQITSLAKKDLLENGKDHLINASIGSLKDEDDELVAYETVYRTFDEISHRQKAAYASGIEGNQEYLDAMLEFVLEDYVTLPKKALATVGGTGAISLVLKNCASEGNTILIPEIAWPSYKVMAEEYHLNVELYDVYDLETFLLKIQKIAEKEDRVTLIINSPCHNPCGHSYTIEEWECIISVLNQCQKEVVLLNDIAYIDYATDETLGRRYLSTFNQIEKNVLVFIAHSASKTFSAYGQRLGTLIFLHQDAELLESIYAVFKKSARALWSNVNNAFMICISKVLKEHKKEFLKEKEAYIQLLNKRKDCFIEVADSLNIPYYPCKEGFFATIKIDNKKRDDLHKYLLDHHVYTVKVQNGLRIALCSTPTNKIGALLSIIKDGWDRQD